MAISDNTAVTTRYTRGARQFHWWIAALIVLAYVLINLRTQFPRGSDPRALVVQSHYWVGIVIFALAFPRLLTRFRYRPPDISPAIERWARVLATAVHIALYAFLFVQPILGMLTVFIGRGSIPIPLTHFSIPGPFTVSREDSHYLEGIHKQLGAIFYYIIGLHIAAALFHHFVRRDDTLKRML
jgi:cytochrome b561